MDWGEFDLTVETLFRQPEHQGARGSDHDDGCELAAGGDEQRQEATPIPGPGGSEATAAGAGLWPPAIAQLFAERQQQLRLCSRSSRQGLDRKLAQALELLTREGQREGVLHTVDDAVTAAEERLGECGGISYMAKHLQWRKLQQLSVVGGDSRVHVLVAMQLGKPD